jgi:3-oxoacyl-[acyl-carrier protein] reductase
MFRMLQSVKDQVIVIARGTRGYGRATAKRQHEVGAQVIITGLDEQTLQEAAREMEGSAAYQRPIA